MTDPLADPLAFILRLVQAELGAVDERTAEAMLRAEMRVRAQLGGERVYIARRTKRLRALDPALLPPISERHARRLRKGKP